MTDPRPEIPPEIPPGDDRERPGPGKAADRGGKPVAGRRTDEPIEVLDGSDSGSDTRAGSLRGGSANGSDDDPDSRQINEALAQEGRALSRDRAQKGDAPPPQ